LYLLYQYLLDTKLFCKDLGRTKSSSQKLQRSKVNCFAIGSWLKEKQQPKATTVESKLFLLGSWPKEKQQPKATAVEGNGRDFPPKFKQYE
jgi:hypothetical protein